MSVSFQITYIILAGLYISDTARTPMRAIRNLEAILRQANASSDISLPFPSQMYTSDAHEYTSPINRIWELRSTMSTWLIQIESTHSVTRDSLCRRISRNASRQLVEMLIATPLHLMVSLGEEKVPQTYESAVNDGERLSETTWSFPVSGALKDLS